MDTVAAGTAAVVETGRFDMVVAAEKAQVHGPIDVVGPMGTTVAAFGTQLAILSNCLPMTGGTKFAALAQSAGISVVMEDRLRADGRPGWIEATMRWLVGMPRMGESASVVVARNAHRCRTQTGLKVWS
jgi:hypothetical protein